MNLKIRYLFLGLILSIQGSSFLLLSQDTEEDSSMYYNSSLTVQDFDSISEKRTTIQEDKLPIVINNKKDTVLLSKDCLAILDSARELYNQGIFEEIHGLLLPCLSTGVPYEQSVEAYKLIILAYLFGDDQSGAENTMLEVLNKYPNFEPVQRDPVELNHYFETFQVIPYLSLGLLVGTNLSFTQITTIYTTGNAINLNYSKSPKIGYQFGLKIGTNFSRKFGVNLEPMIIKNHFAFNEVLFDNHEVSFSEHQTRLDLPLTATYELNRGRFQPYARLGLCAGILLNSSGDAQIDNHASSRIDISSHRKSMSFWAVIGAGMRYKLPKGFLMADLRFNYNMNNQVNESNRYDSDQLWESYYYIDDDYLLHNLQLSVGYTYSFYKAKKLKK